MGKMFAVHLVAFYFSKLKEDQIKKVRTQEAESGLILHRQHGSLPTPAGIESLLENGEHGTSKTLIEGEEDIAYCLEPGSDSELPGG